MKDNKLIAKFMVFPKTNLFDDRTTAYYVGDVIKANNKNNEDDFFHPDDMMFNSSWDWLMPIAERCLCTDEKTDGQHYFINNSLLTCNIEKVYNRVIEFIKNYNESIKNQYENKN